MLIYDVLHKEKVYRSVVNELRNLGVKHRLKKNSIKICAGENNNIDNNGKEMEINSAGFSDSGSRRKVFKVSLSYQPLDAVNLSSGGIVDIPVFLCRACAYLENFFHQEGLFRKAGSQARQKELMARLDNGSVATIFGDKNNNHHAIDVANCLKRFFRDLPEPLIPYAYHDLFVRCLVLRSPVRRVEALMLACIILPPHHLNTLAFFMDFLNKVSRYEALNKMSIDNLATVVGPNIMPLQETTMSAVQTRLEAHLVIVKILIENAKDIGVLPEHISREIANEAIIGSVEAELDHHSETNSRARNNKKKKHRSGSLTRMFNGLRKMVGKSGSPGEVGQSSNQLASMELIAPHMPLLKQHGKKRKVVEPIAPIDVKKKRDISDAMPGERTNHHSRPLFASPVSTDPNPIRETSPLHKSKVRKYLTRKVHKELRVVEKAEKPKKNLRMSLDRFVSRSKQKIIDMEMEIPGDECYSPCIERRWSSASSSSSSKKDREKSSNTVMVKTLTLPMMRKVMTLANVRDDYDRTFMDADVNLSDDAGDQLGEANEQGKTDKDDMRMRMTTKNHRASNNCRQSGMGLMLTSEKIRAIRSNDDVPKHEKNLRSSRRRVSLNNDLCPQTRDILGNGDNSLVAEENVDREEYVRIPKSEYEEIKSRVSAIETRISQELRTSIIANDREVVTRRNSVRKVQSEYEKTLGEALTIETTTINADHLAKRLSKELKIRRSSEHKIIRSPSARKIGILRRRSQEKVTSRRVVGRTASWHVSQRIDTRNIDEKKTMASINRRGNGNNNNNVLQSPKATRELNNVYDDNDDDDDDEEEEQEQEQEKKKKNVRSTIDSLCSDETNARLNYLQEQLRTLITHTTEHTRGTFTDDDDDDEVVVNGADDQFFATPNKLSPHVRRASSFHGNEFIDNSRYFNNRVKELKKSNSQQNIAIKCCDDRDTEMSNGNPTRGKTMSWKDAGGYFNSHNQVCSNLASTPVPQTGRASIAKLRTQNAGMVLAKAKLFDDNETGKMDNASAGIEKKNLGNETIGGTGKIQRLRELTVSNNHEDESSPRKSSLARRKHYKSPRNNNAARSARLASSPLNTPLIKMEFTIVPSHQNPRKTTDNKRLLASNRGVSNKFDREQEHRESNVTMEYENTVVHQKENILKSPTYGQTLPIGTYLKDSNVNMYNPDVTASCKTPHIKRPLAIKTPRSTKSARRATIDTRRTPLKAVPPTIMTPKRQSPRNIFNSRQLGKPV